MRLKGGGGVRLLLVVSSDARRGAEVFGERLATELANRGWQADLVALSTGAGESRIRAALLSGHESGHLPKLDLALVRRLRSLSRSYDVVLANGSSTLRYCVAALIAMGRRPAFVYTSIGEPTYWAAGRRARWRQRLLLARPDRIAAISRETGRQLSALTADNGRITWAPTGVEPKDDVESLDRLSRNLLLVGSLSQEKQPGVALEVASAVSGASLRVAGDGPLRSSLEERASKPDLRDRVVFVGSVDDLGPHYRWADLLLLPSATEGLPGVVLEAASYGVPTVAFDVGGVGEAVGSTQSGVLVDRGDVKAMAVAVASLFEDPGRLREMGDAARQHVGDNYRLDDAIDRYERLLTEAVSARGVRR